MNRARVTQRLVPILRTVRDGWVIIGVTLLLFLGLEGAYRGKVLLGTLLFGSGPVDPVDQSLHPYAGQDWFREFQIESARRADRFDPYRGYWSKPLAGRWKNVDGLGRRVTIQPPYDTLTARRILMLGGSTLFGFNAPDSATIPSLTAARLAARNLRNFEVVNLGQGGFNFTQEVITLQLELAHGRTPAVAVFFHGQNDLQALNAFGEPGHAFTEPRTQSLIDRGRRGFGQELIGLGGYSALIRRMQTMLGHSGGTGTGRHDDEALCEPSARYYRELARSVEALARDRGFDVLFVQQPLLATSNKPLSRWERTIRQPSPLWFRACASAIDSAMRPAFGHRYVSFASLFDGDTATMYTDQFAHLTIDAHKVIAERIAQLIAPAVAGPAEATAKPSKTGVLAPRGRNAPISLVHKNPRSAP